MFKVHREYREGVQRALVTCFLVVFLYLFFSTKVSAAPLMAQTTITGAEHYGMAWEILDIVNAERALIGESALVMDVDLLDYAMLRAAESVLDFNHIRPDGSNIFDDMPGGAPKGENLAVGHTSAYDVMLGGFGWKTSPGHWANIIKTEYTSIGIGVFFAEGRFYYTQIFASTLMPTAAVRRTEIVPTTIATDIAIDVSGAYAAITAETAKTYNLLAGQQISLDLPEIYVQKDTMWTMKVKVPMSGLEYVIADPSIAQIVGTDLGTADIKGLSAGTTTLSIYVNGNQAKAVTFPITVTGHAHTYTSTVIAPTCTTAGYTEHTCTGCGDSYIDASVAALGHTYVVESTVPATCSAAGYIEHKCNDCGDTYQDSIPVVAHTHVATVVAPTCTTAGYTEHVCSDCGDTYQSAQTAELGHNYVETLVSPPTPCMPGGYTEYACTVCTHTYQDSILPSAHTYVSTVIAPTCTVDGYTEHICSDCGDTYQDAVVSAGHSYVSTVVAPTCTVDGYTEYICAGCGDTYQDTIVPAAHDYKDTLVLAATCVTEGLMGHECNVCGDKPADTIIPAHGHVFGAWNVVSEDESAQTEERACIHDGVIERRQVAKTVVTPPEAQAAGPANVGSAVQGNVGNSNNTDTASGGNGNVGGKDNNNTKAPKTGDATSTRIYMFGGITAIIAIGFVVERERRRKY